MPEAPRESCVRLAVHKRSLANSIPLFEKSPGTHLDSDLFWYVIRRTQLMHILPLFSLFNQIKPIVLDQVSAVGSSGLAAQNLTIKTWSQDRNV